MNNLENFEQTNAIVDIQVERDRQDKKFGIQNHSPIEWIAILGEEFGEASKEALEIHFGKAWGYKKDVNELKKNYRAELVQVAAVALNMIECFDRQEARAGNI